MVWFEEIDYGIAFYCGDYIKINKQLNKYPELKQQVIDHEMLHHDSKSDSEDALIDLKDLFKLKKHLKLFLFSCKYPKAFLCNSPLYIIEGTLYYNMFSIYFYVLMTITWLIIFLFIL